MSSQANATLNVLHMNHYMGTHSIMKLGFPHMLKHLISCMSCGRGSGSVLFILNEGGDTKTGWCSLALKKGLFEGCDRLFEVIQGLLHRVLFKYTLFCVDPNVSIL